MRLASEGMNFGDVRWSQDRESRGWRKLRPSANGACHEPAAKHGSRFCVQFIDDAVVRHRRIATISFRRLLFE
jgi:hypothetical protein